MASVVTDATAAAARCIVVVDVSVVVLLVGLAGCNGPQNQTAQDQNAPAGDPANGNLASADQTANQQPAPAESENYTAAPDNSYNTADYESPYETAEANEPPPPLPDYEQPPAPGDDYVWTPGYWAYGDGGYYWVPGAWVLAPYVGALWTPPWWGWADGHYLWHAGYWGPHIGCYGGSDYGFGYTGRGYYGAYWTDGHLHYNRAVTNVNTTVIKRSNKKETSHTGIPSRQRGT